MSAFLHVVKADTLTPAWFSLPAQVHREPEHWLNSDAATHRRLRGSEHAPNLRRS